MSARLPSYRLHKPSGLAVVTIGGRDHYLGPHGSDESRREYDRLIAQWRLAQSSRCDPRLTIGQLVLAFDEHAKTYYRKPDGSDTGTASTFKYACRPLIAEFSRTLVIDFGAVKLKQVRKAMIEAGLARKTINDNVARIVQVFRWGASEEMVPVDVLQSLQTVDGLRKGRSAAKESPPVKPVPVASINAVLPIVSRQVADMIRLQLLSGSRPAEIAQIRPCDVNRDGDVWEYVPATHKTEHCDRDRTIFFGPRAQAILEPWLDRPADSPCFSPIEAEQERRQKNEAARKTPLNYGNRRGTNRKSRPRKQPGSTYNTASYRRAIHRACEEAGVPQWSPNQLRHSRATDLRRQFGIEASRVVLGHSEVGTTEIYAERDMEAARRIMSEVG